MSAEIAGRLKALNDKLDSVKGQVYTLSNKLEKILWEMDAILTSETNKENADKRLKVCLEQIKDTIGYSKGYIDGL